MDSAPCFREEGYRVISAANGKEAIAPLQGQPTPDLMLQDMMMPDGDGWEMRKLWKSAPSVTGGATHGLARA